MEDSKTKVEVMKPILLKAGLPLAISVVGLIFSRLISKRSSVRKPSKSENQLFPHEESFLSFDSNSLPRLEDDEYTSAITHFTNPLARFPSSDRRDMEEEVLCLRQRIEELQDKEWRLETRFLDYCKMKDHESVLRELENVLSLEIARMELLEKEVSSLEAENRRFVELVVGFFGVLEQNGLLQRKVKKLYSKISGLSRVISEKDMQIEVKEHEISTNHVELQRNSSAVKSLENQITELQAALEKLLVEKNELSEKLYFAKKAASQKDVQIEEKEREISIGQDELKRKSSVVVMLENLVTELQTALQKVQVEKNELLYKVDLAEKTASQKVGANRIREDEYNQLVDELKKLQKDQASEFNEVIYLRWSNACLRHQLLKKNLEQEEEAEETKMEAEYFEDIHQVDSVTHGDLSAIEFKGNAETDGLGGGHSHSRRQKLIKKLKKWVDGSDQKTKHEGKCFTRSLASVGIDEEYLPPRKSYSSV